MEYAISFTLECQRLRWWVKIELTGINEKYLVGKESNGVSRINNRLHWNRFIA